MVCGVWGGAVGVWSTHISVHHYVCTCSQVTSSTTLCLMALKKSFLLNREVTILVKLFGEWALGICLSLFAMPKLYPHSVMPALLCGISRFEPRCLCSHNTCFYPLTHLLGSMYFLKSRAGPHLKTITLEWVDPKAWVPVPDGHWNITVDFHSCLQEPDTTTSPANAAEPF